MKGNRWWGVSCGVLPVVLGVLSAAPLSAQSALQEDVFSLRRAIQVGLANSGTLEDAEFGLRVADQQVREAWGSILPDISVSASYSRNLLVQQIFLPAEFFGGPPGETRPVRVGSDNSWTAGLNVSQSLFEYGVFVGVGAAGRFRGLQEEVLRGTTQQVVTVVRQAYFDALLADEELRLTEKSIERLGQTLEETRALNRAGLVSNYDVLRIEVEYSNVQANLQRAENSVRARRRALLVELGFDPERLIALEGQLSGIDLDEADVNTRENAELLLLAGAPEPTRSEIDALLQTAMRRRTDLRQLRSTVLLEEARVGVEKADFFPRLSVFTNYNIFAQEDGSPSFFGETSDQRTRTAAAGVQIELPIFRGFQRFARVRQAQATVRRNETRLERAELEAVNQVRSLAEATEEARSRARSQRRAVEQAQRGFEIASTEYREGLGSQLQVTDAEVALRQSEFNYARAVYDYLSARAQLEFAIGTVPEEPGAFPVAVGR
jgi:outer membrane protein TolC